MPGPAMTVGELRAALDKADPKMPVLVRFIDDPDLLPAGVTPRVLAGTAKGFDVGKTAFIVESFDRVTKAKAKP